MLGILIIFLSYPSANRTFQTITLVFIGLWIFVQSEIPVTRLPEYMTSTALLLSLLYFHPFIYHLIKVGMFEVELKNLLEMRTRHLGQFYYRSSLIGYVLCLFVFFSAITIVHQVVDDVSEKNRP